MRHSPLFPLILCALLLLPAACGPRDIGAGTSEPDSRPVGISGADSMRQPMTGNNRTQTMLYYVNRPDVMQSMQRNQYNYMMHRMGRDLSPEDPAYRAVPRQRSPFRQ